MINPLDHCNVMQQEIISKLTKVKQEKHGLIFSYGNAAYCYHDDATRQEPTCEDYQEWLSGLSDPVGKEMEITGRKNKIGLWHEANAVAP